VDTTDGNAVLATTDLVAGASSLGWALTTIPAAHVSGQAQAIAVGDFNADGIPDLVVATAGTNGQQGDVSVLLGKGDGSFAPAINIPALTNNTGIAVGNFVTGGPLDIVSVDQGSSSNNIVFTITDGTGHLASQSFFTTPFPPGVMAVGPNSSYIVVTALEGATYHGATVYPSNGNGTFASPTTFAVGSYADGIVGTSNGVAVTLCPPAPALGEVAIVLLQFEANGLVLTAAPINYTVGHCPAGIATGSFTSKGGADLIVANNGDDTMQVLLDNGNGSYTVQAPFSVGKGPYGVVVGDFNGDGKADFAVTSQTANTVSIFLGNGDGTFSAPETFPVGNGPQSIAAGSFTKGGKVDLAMVNATDATISNLLSFSAPTATASADKITLQGSGAHQVVAQYSGSADYSASQSNAVTLGVGQVATSLSLTASATSITYGTSVTLSATVSPATATGTVTFKNGSTTLGTGTLSSGTASLTLAATTANGFALGSNSTTAVYVGDSNDLGSTSTTVTLVVTTGTTTTVTISPSSIPLGSSSLTPNLTATVAATGWNPVGIVTFEVGSVTVGSAPLSNGSATLRGVSPTTANGFTVGSDTITASYNPTSGSGFVASSGTQSLSVTAPAYTSSPSTTTVSLGKGGSQSVTVTLASTTFADTTSWTATASSALITVSPTSGTATLAANGSSIVNLTISASNSAANHAPRLPWTSGLIAFGAVLAGVPLAHRRKRVVTAVLIALAISTIGVLMSCGGGGSGTHPVSPRNYTVTISGTGGINSTIAVTVQ
jgi:hypothetical protein